MVDKVPANNVDLILVEFGIETNFFDVIIEGTKDYFKDVIGPIFDFDKYFQPENEE